MTPGVVILTQEIREVRDQGMRTEGGRRKGGKGEYDCDLKFFIISKNSL